MRRSKTAEIRLTEQEQAVLRKWSRKGSGEQRLADRARIILMSHEGVPVGEIAQKLRTRLARVSKWRQRFVRDRLNALSDAARSGKPAQYDLETDRRVLALLDRDPPPGYAQWNGRLLAEALGDVSPDHTWRILRKYKIQLQRRRSWCISTEPEFGPKAADVVGIYLDPPEHALVLSVDEKPHIQALERARGFLRLPDGKAVNGFNHCFKRNGTATLFAAMNIVTGQVETGHYPRRRREFLDFMNGIAADNPDCMIHVLLDNLNTHEPKRDRWLTSHPNVHLHFIPTYGLWLNQVLV
jgi:transposase